MYGDSVPGYVLRREVSVQYPDIETNYFSSVQYNLKEGARDTIPTVFVHWKKGLKEKEKKSQSEKLGSWLQVRLNMDTVRVVEY